MGKGRKRVKLIESGYNKETGVSFAKIDTSYGIFEGTSKIHEEDKDIASEFLGCRYAEFKARLKYERVKLTKYKNKYKFLKDLYDNMNNLKWRNEKHVEYRFIKTQYLLAEEAVKKQKEKITTMQEVLHKGMLNYRESRETILNIIKSKRNKKEEEK